MKRLLPAAGAAAILFAPMATSPVMAHGVGISAQAQVKPTRCYWRAIHYCAERRYGYCIKWGVRYQRVCPN